MKPILLRSLPALMLAIGCVAASGASRPAETILQPDKLVLLSTTDVKGKTVPCGCHIPKGGLARRATFVDSLRTLYGQVLLVDNGGFFPEDDAHREAAGFMMDEMGSLGTVAANVAGGDLRFGRAFLEQSAQHSGVPLVSANLLDKTTHKPVFNAYLVKQAGSVKVGIFGLMSAKVDLGPDKESMVVTDPVEAARSAVAALKHEGAQVILLLSQLGKFDGEDLVAAVDGIDATMMGKDVAVLQRGRMVKNTIACYGGDQGHYVCRTEISLNSQRHAASAQAEAVIMGPEVRDKPDIAAKARALDDAINQKLEKERKQHEVKS